MELQNKKIRDAADIASTSLFASQNIYDDHITQGSSTNMKSNTIDIKSSRIVHHLENKKQENEFSLMPVGEKSKFSQDLNKKKLNNSILRQYIKNKQFHCTHCIGCGSIIWNNELQSQDSSAREKRNSNRSSCWNLSPQPLRNVYVCSKKESNSESPQNIDSKETSLNSYDNESNTMTQNCWFYCPLGSTKNDYQQLIEYKIHEYNRGNDCITNKSNVDLFLSNFQENELKNTSQLSNNNFSKYRLQNFEFDDEIDNTKLNKCKRTMILEVEEDAEGSYHFPSNNTSQQKYLIKIEIIVVQKNDSTCGNCCLGENLLNSTITKNSFLRGEEDIFTLNDKTFISCASSNLGYDTPSYQENENEKFLDVKKNESSITIDDFESNLMIQSQDSIVKNKDIFKWNTSKQNSDMPKPIFIHEITSIPDISNLELVLETCRDEKMLNKNLIMKDQSQCDGWSPISTRFFENDSESENTQDSEDSSYSQNGVLFENELISIPTLWSKFITREDFEEENEMNDCGYSMSSNTQRLLNKNHQKDGSKYNNDNVGMIENNITNALNISEEHKSVETPTKLVSENHQDFASTNKFELGKQIIEECDFVSSSVENHTLSDILVKEENDFVSASDFQESSDEKLKKIETSTFVSNMTKSFALDDIDKVLCNQIPNQGHDIAPFTRASRIKSNTLTSNEEQINFLKNNDMYTNKIVFLDKVNVSTSLFENENKDVCESDFVPYNNRIMERRSCWPCLNLNESKFAMFNKNKKLDYSTNSNFQNKKEVLRELKNLMSRSKDIKDMNNGVNYEHTPNQGCGSWLLLNFPIKFKKTDVNEKQENFIMIDNTKENEERYLLQNKFQNCEIDDNNNNLSKLTMGSKQSNNICGQQNSKIKSSELLEKQGNSLKKPNSIENKNYFFNGGLSKTCNGKSAKSSHFENVYSNLNKKKNRNLHLNLQAISSSQDLPHLSYNIINERKKKNMFQHELESKESLESNERVEHCDSFSKKQNMLLNLNQHKILKEQASYAKNNSHGILSKEKMMQILNFENVQSQENDLIDDVFFESQVNDTPKKDSPIETITTKDKSQDSTLVLQNLNNEKNKTINEHVDLISNTEEKAQEIDSTQFVVKKELSNYSITTFWDTSLKFRKNDKHLKEKLQTSNMHEMSKLIKDNNHSSSLKCLDIRCFNDCNINKNLNQEKINNATICNTIIKLNEVHEWNPSSPPIKEIVGELKIKKTNESESSTPLYDSNKSSFPSKHSKFLYIDQIEDHNDNIYCKKISAMLQLVITWKKVII